MDKTLGYLLAIVDLADENLPHDEPETLVFELSIDPVDEDEAVGEFDTGAGNHYVQFYGPTAEHVIGLAYLYGRKKAGGQPFKIEIDAHGSISIPELP